MKSRRYRGNVARRLCDRRTWGEQRELLHETAAPVVENLCAEGTRAGRHPDVVRVRVWRQRRQHADDRVDLVIHGEGRADDLWIAAQLVHPEAVAEQHDWRRADSFFSRTECAPEQRLHAEHVEVVVGHDAGLDALRIAAAE